MLKIRDEVKLQELEEFGFKKENFQYVVNRCKDKKLKFDGFGVDKDTRQIHNYAVLDDTLDTLYDLIQHGLVEKA